MINIKNKKRLFSYNIYKIKEAFLNLRPQDGLLCKELAGDYMSWGPAA